MDEHNKTTSPPNSPKLCIGGCGFYGNEHFQGLCSKCYGAKNKGARPTSPKLLSAEFKPPTSPKLKNTQADNIRPPETKLLSRKHRRPASIVSYDLDQLATTPVGVPTTSASPTKYNPATTESSSNTVTETILPAGDTNGLDKPIQKNKGRCFKCRIKVPLAKQTINKCKCDYVFCDSHRFPEVHDCEIDYAKIGRDLLAKNNPKLRERPKGGTSFTRIDSL